jgi:two-component system LytT family response regulator
MLTLLYLYPMIRCILIDDEPNAVKILEGYINKIPSMLLCGRFYDAFEAVEYLKNEQVDIIITDINMPLISGFQLAAFLPESQKFIFITAHAEYALNSFRYHVIDYLLKPVEFGRFQKAIEKISPAVKEPSAAGAPDNIFVRSSGQLVRIAIADILYIKGEKEYIRLQLTGSKLLIYKRMKAMELVLPGYFKRVHISFIVNTNHIQKVANNMIIVAGAEIPISDSYRNAFFDFIGGQLI